ncbi:uncharacterized protein CEXT_542051 [Caerostris extrusa]|uniref:Uncharacterized protein n=1 Tax=Caerostris extrusa TaxID=172846 RepID=A0AAV4PG15_CAEEX|nr:uncharacterized protein CEXT_542051 [Caerostris extrusa]
MKYKGIGPLLKKKALLQCCPHPRSGRRFFRLPQASTVIPYPRTGRMLVDPDTLDYEFSFVPDYSWSSLDYPITDNLIEGKSVSSKRGSIAFPPRVGRKKRSISDEESGNNDLSNSKKLQGVLSRMMSSDWSFLDEEEPDLYLRQERRPKAEAGTHLCQELERSDPRKISMPLKKKGPCLSRQESEGRLIPRIGRNDPRFEVKSRGAFIPRIGRRAALTPRIGRSENHQSSNDETK